MITKKILFRLSFISLYVFIIGIACFTQHKTALAATHVSGYQITVTESAPTMFYGESSPSFRAVLTVPAGESPISNLANFFIQIDGQGYQGGGSVSGTTPTYYLYLAGTYGTALSVGQHSVIAVYRGSGLGTGIESAPIELTVLKNTPALDCFISQLNYTYTPNTPLTITLSFSNTNTPVDWQNGTETISFVGTRTFTYANLKPNSSIQVFVSTPPVPDTYRLRCIFNGTKSFNSVEADLSATVSASYQPGIKLYTNPTTLKSGLSTTWYVVVSGASGLPVPTGSVAITIGSSYTRLIALGSDGTLTSQGIAPFISGTAIRILYSGDTVYKWYDASFPLTNPPLPATGANPPASTSVGGTPSPTSSNSPTPLPTNVTKTAGTPGASTTIARAGNPDSSSTPIAANGTGGGPTGNTPSGDSITKPPDNQADTRNWILFGALVSVASSGIVGVVVLRRRTITASTRNDKTI
jgi:hypothetical protein